jgi:hypothetical protein
MRYIYILCLLIALLAPSLVSAEIVYVQSAKDATHAGGDTNTPALSNVQVGSLLVLACTNSVAQTISTVADSESTTIFTKAHNVGSATTGYNQEHWWAIAKIAGTHNLTVTASANTAEFYCALLEYTGVRADALGYVDGQEQINPGTGTDAITSTAQTTVNAGSLVIGMSLESGGTGTITAGTNFTCRQDLFGTCGAPADGMVYDRIQATPGSIAATATTTDATAGYITGMSIYLPDRKGSMTLGVGN